MGPSLQRAVAGEPFSAAARSNDEYLTEVVTTNAGVMVNPAHIKRKSRGPWNDLHHIW